MSDPERRAVEDRMLGATGLTAHDSSFDRNAILRAWCDALPPGAPISGSRTSPSDSSIGSRRRPCMTSFPAEAK